MRLKPVFCLIALVFAFSANSVFAQVSSSEVMEDLADEISAAEAEILRAPSSFRFLGYYDSAASAIYRGSMSVGDESAKFWGEDKYTGAPGFALDYSHRNANDIGVSVGAAYEFARRAKSYDFEVEGNLFGKGEMKTGAEFSLFALYVNANWTFGRNWFVYAGPNYSLPSYHAGIGRGKMSGELGFQLGVGWNPWERLEVEAAYQQKNFQYFEGKLAFDSYKFEGLQLRVGYRL